MEMTEKERVTVDLDAECYYLDGEYWESWDHFGEEMADAINILLNEQEEEIQRLKWSNKILRTNKKDCELGRREERKRWVEIDKMRIEHIRLLQKRLKENGLSIYIDGDVE